MWMSEWMNELFSQSILIIIELKSTLATSMPVRPVNALAVTPAILVLKASEILNEYNSNDKNM